MHLRSWLVAAVLVAMACALSRADDARMPYRVSVGAAYGDPLGPESLRDALERQLVTGLRLAECFERVDVADEEADARADLIVEVILDEFDQSTRYDVSVATQNREDGDPESKQRYTAVASALLYLQVRRGADRALVKMNRTHPVASRRAEPGVDVRSEVYAGLIDTIVRQTRSFLCKPTRKKWEKQIQDARPAD
jgi:hypothetical protein